jgi:hypothetical protein
MKRGNDDDVDEIVTFGNQENANNPQTCSAGHAVRPGAKFCTTCGISCEAPTCPSGHRVRIGAKFCHTCGVSLVSVEPFETVAVPSIRLVPPAIIATPIKPITAGPSETKASTARKCSKSPPKWSLAASVALAIAIASGLVWFSTPTMSDAGAAEYASTINAESVTEPTDGEVFADDLELAIADEPESTSPVTLDEPQSDLATQNGELDLVESMHENQSDDLLDLDYEEPQSEVAEGVRTTTRASVVGTWVTTGGAGPAGFTFNNSGSMTEHFYPNGGAAMQERRWFWTLVDDTIHFQDTNTGRHKDWTGHWPNPTGHCSMPTFAVIQANSEVSTPDVLELSLSCWTHNNRNEIHTLSFVRQ